MIFGVFGEKTIRCKDMLHRSVLIDAVSGRLRAGEDIDYGLPDLADKDR